jgi:DMSO/TMAO reductase YedYZ molybdopterin-dependent catalytic subunit
MRRALASPARTPRMAVVMGRLLATAFVLCFFTGLYSHFLQEPLPWMRFPTAPSWLYQLTQGVHITAGIACFPLILGKLHAVYPRLFQFPPARGLGSLLERASIALFVAASLVEITIGLLNTFQWYPWPFDFRQVHFALSFVVIGSLAVHIGVKLPIIARYWRARPAAEMDAPGFGDDAHPDDDEVMARQAGAELEPVGSGDGLVGGLTGRVFRWIDSAPAATPRITRRGFFAAIGLSAAAVVLTTAGQSFSALNPLNVFAPRTMGVGPQGLPINRTAEAAQVTDTANASDWVLTVANGNRIAAFSRAELSAMPQTTVDLPIACVEGWSQTATWTGVPLRDLMSRAGMAPDARLRVTSLEKEGGYRVMEMGPEYVFDSSTLVALQLGGETLDIQHGYPARMIAPGRPGVLQTKWLSSLEVI